MCRPAVTLAALLAPFPASASTWLPFGNDATIEVTYTALLPMVPIQRVCSGKLTLWLGKLLRLLLPMTFPIRMEIYTKNGTSSSIAIFGGQTAPSPS
jgi:hypothetical protein